MKYKFKSSRHKKIKYFEKVVLLKNKKIQAPQAQHANKKVNAMFCILGCPKKIEAHFNYLPVGYIYIYE